MGISLDYFTGTDLSLIFSIFPYFLKIFTISFLLVAKGTLPIKNTK